MPSTKRKSEMPEQPKHKRLKKSSYEDSCLATDIVQNLFDMFGVIEENLLYINNGLSEPLDSSEKIENLQEQFPINLNLENYNSKEMMLFYKVHSRSLSLLLETNHNKEVTINMEREIPLAIRDAMFASQHAKLMSEEQSGLNDEQKVNIEYLDFQKDFFKSKLEKNYPNLFNIVSQSTEEYLTI